MSHLNYSAYIQFEYNIPYSSVLSRWTCHIWSRLCVRVYPRRKRLYLAWFYVYIFWPNLSAWFILIIRYKLVRYLTLLMLMLMLCCSWCLSCRRISSSVNISFGIRLTLLPRNISREVIKQMNIYDFCLTVGQCYNFFYLI